MWTTHLVSIITKGGQRNFISPVRVSRRLTITWHRGQVTRFLPGSLKQCMCMIKDWNNLPYISTIRAHISDCRWVTISCQGDICVKWKANLLAITQCQHTMSRGYTQQQFVYSILTSLLLVAATTWPAQVHQSWTHNARMPNCFTIRGKCFICPSARI